MTKTVNLEEAQSQLPDLLALAMQGHEIIIELNDKPMAKLTPCGKPPNRVPGLDAGLVHIADDFDDPLPDDLQKYFE